MKTLPAVKFVLALSAGIILGSWVSITPSLLVSFTFLLLLIIFGSFLSRYIGVGITKIPLAKSSPILLLIILFGWSSATLHLKPIDYPEEQLIIKGIIFEPAYKSDALQRIPLRIIEVRSVQGERLRFSGKIWCNLPNVNDKYHLGETLLLKGTLRPFQQKRNPGQPDFKGFYEKNNYIGEFAVIQDLSDRIPKTRKPIRQLVLNYTFTVSEKLFRDNAPLINALITGIRRDIPSDFSESLRLTGLSHLIALSGLHVGFIIALCWGFGALFHLPYRMRILLTLIVLGIFLSIVVPRSSTIRAVLMGVTFLSSPLFKRWSHPVNTFAFSALIILLIKPLELFDVGFQLSYAAIGGIILFHKHIEANKHKVYRRRGKWMRLMTVYIGVPFAYSLSALAMTLPLTSYHFGTLSIGAAFFNLIALPMLVVIYAGTIITFILYPIFAGFTMILADGINLFIVIWMSFIQFGAQIAPVVAKSFSPLMVVLSILLTIYLGTRQPEKKFALKLLVAMLIFSSIALANSHTHQKLKKIEIWFLDVGHGDAAVILLPPKQCLVIDVGNQVRNNKYHPVINLMSVAEHKKIDLLILTHLHADHIGGAINLLETQEIDLIVRSSGTSTTATSRRLLELIDEKEIPEKMVFANSHIEGFEPLIIKILNPPEGAERWKLNDQSVVALLQFHFPNGDTLNALFTGDIEKRAERHIVDKYNIQADLLKIPHHGSHNSSSLEFLRMVNPRDGIFSSSSRARYGQRLPADVILMQYQELGIKTHFTNIEGAIMFQIKKVGGKFEWVKVDWRNPSFLTWFIGLRSGY